VTYAQRRKTKKVTSNRSQIPEKAHYELKLDWDENKVNRNITNFDNAPKSIVGNSNVKTKVGFSECHHL